MTAPLQGIRVIDWTQVQSGPSCTQMLAWLGADVIKIERKGLGDPTRTELLDYPDMDSLYYLQLNCNKRSIELDMKTSEGKEILTRLLETADVFVENLHPGAVDTGKWGIVIESLDGSINHTRIDLVYLFPREAQLVHGPRVQVFYKDIGCFEQSGQDFLSFRSLHIQFNGTLVAVQLQIIQTIHIGIVQQFGTGRIT